MKATKEVDIYLIQKRNVRAIDVVQYDTGVQLVFAVKDFTIPSGATATLYVQKPSGKFVFQEDGISVAGNIITVNLENQAITEHGKVPYQVSLKDGSDEITTFTGLMMVEKSLKDAGATEAKTVIRAFDEAVSDHVAEFQAKAEQIVQACIATIPDDYSAMSAKVNALANAVNGYLSGAVVFADDVSPVEHEMAVKAHGRNLFDISKIESSPDATNNFDGTITIASGSYAVGTKLLNELCPALEEGKLYTLSLTTNSKISKYIYLVSVDSTWDSGKSLVMTKEILNSKVNIYGMHSTEEGFGQECIISNIQIEEGSTATEYTPYIDPSTVTVTADGMNYIPASDGTVNGIPSTALVSGITTNNSAVTVECEYNRDTNKVIDKLINAITALGGTV